jgi:multiple sugar transport system substrate-binding protein
VHAKDKVKDAAYAFFSYMSQSPQSKIDVTIGKTGFNPYRTSHFKDLGPWLDSGMSKEEATSYLGAIQDSLNSPNMILDLRIPQNQKYQQVVLDEALSRYLSGEIDEKTAISTIESGWNDLNDQIGKDAQLAAYKSTLGLQR